MKELRLMATTAGMDQVNAFIEDELDAYEVPSKVFMQLMVAVEELYVNIAHYAYKPLRGEALVQVDFDEAEHMVLIRLIDWGKEFDPLAKADPDTTLPAEDRPIGGLGIYMVKKIMDLFTYERIDGQNIVTIGRKI